MSSLKACGLSAVQLALDPIREASKLGGGPWGLERTCQILQDAGITVLSGMIGTVGEDYTTLETIRATGGVRPDRHWQQNLHNARVSAAIAEALGLETVTFHAGFVPHSPDEDEFHVMAHRIAELGDVFGERGIAIALETGQEPPDGLLALLECSTPAMHEELGSPWVNFDPANMVLYGSGDPIAGLATLASCVRQVHVKDATPTQTPGRWGSEVPAGTGVVDWRRFFAILAEQCPDADLVIEREAGTARIEDVRRAVELIRAHVPGCKVG
ncbi:MAG TPA: sugar phosphate isomerase/epimerase family protein [Phycisphaerales bacterium]|nr:sugar phosphate isomerase/epimerase family protein [Phycisphaerales bacterium]